MTDKLEALKASARGIARLLGDIASFDSWDIDGDIVDIRFEDENGCDTGADVSITETADKASQVIGELLAALEEAKSKNYLVDMLEWRGKAEEADRRVTTQNRHVCELFDEAKMLRERNAELEQRLQMEPGQADQRRAESRAVRVALGFGEDAIDVAPVDLVEAIQAITQRAAAAERQLAALPADWSKDSSLVTWFPFTAAKLAELEQQLQESIKLPRVAAIYTFLSDVARHRTSAENVRDVVEAIQAHAISKIEEI
ncbi:MAG: hypothetical protein ACRDCA_12580 [Serratia sp. (in: enterobacteria)]|uniref:hypothetical protein n=1 Tax=Serratia sp. (in: enterobacteria) TaxID=616 RepID=UPI003F32D9F1